MSVSRRAPHAIDHLSLGVRGLGRAVAFYDAVLRSLGQVRVWSGEKGVEYGARGGAGVLALFEVGSRAKAPGPGWHLALAAPSRRAVEAFHAAAMLAGGTDEGAPGLRPRYGPGYYAAFVRDPDGHRIEAVFHGRAGRHRPSPRPSLRKRGEGGGGQPG